MVYSILLVIVLEVLVSFMVGLGVYYGFSVFPFSSIVTTAAGDAGQSQITMTIPIAMPGLSDLKVPYTYLDIGTPGWGVATFVVSATLIVLQSFVRGMYLGGLHAWVQRRSVAIVPLFACGRKFFARMLSWSVFQLLSGVLTLLLAAAFVPFGLIMLIIVLFYSLTPYLIVLQDISFGEAMSKAPRLLRSCFKTLLPLALIAVLGTTFISFLKQLPPPFGYAVPLLAYAVAGTFLIAELMKLLADQLPKLGEEVPRTPLTNVMTNRIIHDFMISLLILVMTAVGAFVASGQYLGALSWGGNKSLTGIAYHTNFSDVFYRSGQSYNSYEWKPEDHYRIEIKLPDKSGERHPEELRGVASITWRMEEKVRYRNGRTTHITIEPFTIESKLLYRLVRETSEDGSIYYSSKRGTASILSGGKQPREPLSVEMMVSGDGSNVFVLQYPSGFDASQIFRVSENGRYLTMGTSKVNPMDFHAYWFRESHQAEEILEMLSYKNRISYVSDAHGIIASLAAALQEADGRMVVEVLDILNRRDVPLDVPAWDEEAWTDYLRSLYDGVNLQDMLGHLTKAGIQGGYRDVEIHDRSTDEIGAYRLEVPFPNDTMTIEYERSRENHSLQSVSVIE